MEGRRIKLILVETCSVSYRQFFFRHLVPTKPQSTGNDKFKTQLSTETLTLVTINIEGFPGNQVYLQTLSNRADILLLQEHWLHTFEKHKLDDFLPDYVCLTPYFDRLLSGVRWYDWRAPVRCLSRIFGGRGWNKKLSELSPVFKNVSSFLVGCRKSSIWSQRVWSLLLLTEMKQRT
jgi:hypothetical protein